MKKVIWTLNIGNYAPELTALTYPLLVRYAKKIDAEFRIITERKFPDFPVVYEKLQIHELGRDYDWNYYIDGDALIHPDMFDVTNHLNKDTVCHTAQDMAGNRWKYDDYFRRDGRHIGSCNWFTVGSNWCLDLWKPLDISMEEAIGNIFPIQHELNSGVITADHLIDDYTLSRNIAKYGLKFDTVRNIRAKTGDQGDYFHHLYTISIPEKRKLMETTLIRWGLMKNDFTGFDCIDSR